MSAIAKPKAWVSPTRAGVALVAVLLGVSVADWWNPPDLARYNDRSTVVSDKDGQTLRMFTASDGAWRIGAKAAEVDQRYLTFLKAYEDKRFDDHYGVDPIAVVRAAGQWIANAKPVSGASTLTMQVVRLLEPRPRTLWSKGIEVLRAVQLERRFTKPEILSIYLTLAPFGGNIEGIEAATQLYFGKKPARLTVSEAALLVVLPQSPSRLRPDRHPKRARAARDKVLVRLRDAGVLSADALRVARLEPVPKMRRDAPFLSPHLAQRLKVTHPERYDIITTIDSHVQSELEILGARHLERLGDGETLAVLVVDTRTRAVVAYVGSGAFLDPARDGQVDMVRAVRSPGSALKPFIYGLAFDHLNLHPETLVDDRPTRFGDYAPTNFDHRFRGAVTIREALQLSLNVPAVAVLDALGPERFYRTLGNAGMILRLDPRLNKPALPMALGGIGATLWDMTGLYAGLADAGRWRPLSVLRDTEQTTPKPMMSAKAAWYVARILDDTPPPQTRVSTRFLPHGRRIALKTGTAYGFRDAWAFGFDARHTVGVWVGRPDGTFGTGRTGRKRAAPILYDVFDRLAKPEGSRRTKPPRGVLSLKTQELPPPMRGFRMASAEQNADGLEIAFPPADALIEGDGRAIELRARGGMRPLVWLVNGTPLPSKPFRRSARWRPDGDGGYRISVVDRNGHAAASEIWVRSLNSVP